VADWAELGVLLKAVVGCQYCRPGDWRGTQAGCSAIRHANTSFHKIRPYVGTIPQDALATDLADVSISELKCCWWTTIREV